MYDAGDIDGSALELAFSKKKVEERKQWLQGYVPGTYLDMTQDTISYNDFVNKACLYLSTRSIDRTLSCVRCCMQLCHAS